MLRLCCERHDRAIASQELGSLSMRVFETRPGTGQDSGVHTIFILIIFNGEKILNNVNVIV